MSESVKVCVRCRPLNEQEKSNNYQNIVDMDSTIGTIQVNSANQNKCFTFDNVFDQKSNQTDIYEKVVKPIVESVLEGYNGTIFAYGQTGTGKTYTMQGIKSDKNMRGVIPNSFHHIFDHISSSVNRQYLVRCSYLEIYMEDVRDLLSNNQSNRLELKERPDTGVYVKDLSTIVTKNVEQVQRVMDIGDRNRSVGSTNMNEHSSRSHAIFTVTIECSAVWEDGEEHIHVGKLNMVDLAGSEKQSKTGSTGERFMESVKINLSLSTLGNVISALVDPNSTHIPYRDSKLTRLLQSSLGGNSKTLMIANIGPANYNYEETLLTLRYANRTKNIKNKPQINEDPKDAILRTYQLEIEKLTSLLQNKAQGSELGHYGNDDTLQNQKRVLDEEKQNILNNDMILENKKKRLMSELDVKQQHLQQQECKRIQLSKKLEAMQSKLLHGSFNFVQYTQCQKNKLQQKREELEKQELKEREILKQIQQKNETSTELKETYTSLQQEAEIKTKKLKKLISKLELAKKEMVKLKDAHSLELQEFMQVEEDLIKDIKLKKLIVDNFIPLEEVEKVKKVAYCNEENDNWILDSFLNSEVHKEIFRRPFYTKSILKAVKFDSMGSTTADEDIGIASLDMPERTTKQYEDPDVAPSIKAALDVALEGEQDIEVINSTTLHRIEDQVKYQKTKSSKSNKNPKNYPTARGLVKK